MKKKGLVWKIALVAVGLIFVFAGCAKKKEEVKVEKAIKIPVASPYTGPLATFGEGVKNAALLMGEEVNAAGGINGRKVDIVLGDDLCDPKEAANVATKFAADPDVFIVIGHLCSSSTMAALPIYKEAKLPAISPASTNPAIGKMSPYYFRDVYKDDFQGVFLAKYVKEVMGWNKIAIFYEMNDYSIGLKNAFEGEASTLGIEILGEEAYTSDTTDFTPQLTKLKTSKPDAIFIPGYAPQATLIISQAAKLGIKTGFFGADGLDDKIMLANPDAEGLLITTPFLPDKAGPDAQKFIKAYKKKYNVEPNWFAANTYDAVGMAVQAMMKVGTDREKIRDYLASLNSPEKAYKGVTGATYFDENGDCLKPAFVKTIKNGKWLSAEKQMTD
ncbi:leucine-, isoleucine-, valine-, threonine-, and alanine-binding protein precursor [bacterium BMS3Abin14]|nr:leucine-, isoleucine-, valine-, threonine-, and alanine-binding protein precursor [bacterium BMS3Abin14]